MHFDHVDKNYIYLVAIYFIPFINEHPVYIYIYMYKMEADYLFYIAH